MSIGPLAAMYFITVAITQAPDPYWLLGFLSFAFILPVNSVAVACNSKLLPNFENNESFSGWNWVAVVLGGVTFALSLVGAFLPQDFQV